MPWLISALLQSLCRFPFGVGCIPEHAVDSRRALALVFSDSPYSQIPGRLRAGQHPLQGFHPAPFAFPTSLRNPHLHSPDVPLHTTPIDVVPLLRSAGKRRPGLLAELFHAAFLSRWLNHPERKTHADP